MLLWLACALAACNVLGGIDGALLGCAQDGLQGGFETDVDCGGGCGRCPSFAACDQSSDCASEVCLDNICQPPECVVDGDINGIETDVDCGGGCPPCSDFSLCEVGDDCTSGVCFAEEEADVGSCFPASCGDGVRNGFESDIDCGGSFDFECIRCAVGERCGEDTDCGSFYLADALGIGACFDDGAGDEGACLPPCCLEQCGGDNVPSCFDLLCDNVPMHDCCMDPDPFAACCAVGCGAGLYGAVCQGSEDCLPGYKCVEVVSEMRCL